MSRIKSIGLAITSVLVMAAGAAAAANASTPPHWILNGSSLTTTLVPILSTNLSPSMVLPETVQRFTNSTESVECANVTSTGFIWNEGTPPTGKDQAHILFTGCKVWEGKTYTTELPLCSVEDTHAKKPGTILVEANTELVYLEANEKGPIGDLFSPASGTTFVELNFAGTCKSTGITKVVGSVVANMLVGLGTAPNGGGGSENVESFLMFPTTAITKSFSGSTLGERKDGLKVFGTVTATQSGESLVMIPGYNKTWGAS